MESACVQAREQGTRAQFKWDDECKTQEFIGKVK